MRHAVIECIPGLKKVQLCEFGLRTVLKHHLICLMINGTVYREGRRCSSALLCTLILKLDFRSKRDEAERCVVSVP